MTIRKQLAAVGAIAALLVLVSFAPKNNDKKLRNGEYTFQILTTNDVHGTYFDSTYVGGRVHNSLMAVKRTVDSVRTANGAENVLLIDAGDILQGDNVAYYFNYVDTVTPHIYPRMAKYMGYDAVTLGNHDIETGHPVYDRFVRECNALGIPVLAGNAIRNDNGEPYFQMYTILNRNGIKIAILGFDNANIKNWLSEKLWSGMTFKSLIPLVQEDVDKVIEKEHPQIVIVSLHTGTGMGDGSIYESQGLDVFNSIHGVDFVLTSHDHRPFIVPTDTMCMINSGSHSRNVGHGTITLKVRKGQVVSKKTTCELIPVDAEKIDVNMQKMFRDDFLAVRKFTTTPIGDLKTDLNTRDAYAGMSDYLNLIHTVSLACKPAQISFAAPLTFNGFIPAGGLVYNDLFTIYPYENQLYVVKMTGSEIKTYLEASYNNWVRTVSSADEHVLNIRNMDDPRNGMQRWSFAARSYNFDSAAGIDYTVDVTKPAGERITISSLADGTAFDLNATYNVAMTSYRASGGGDLLKDAGIDTDKIDERVVEYYPEIRELIYEYLQKNGCIDHAGISDPAVIGSWSFVPYEIAIPAVTNDMRLLFGDGRRPEGGPRDMKPGDRKPGGRPGEGKPGEGMPRERK